MLYQAPGSSQGPGRPVGTRRPCHRGGSAAAQDKLAEIVNEAKRSGVVQRAIERAGFKGVRVAPE